MRTTSVKKHLRRVGNHRIIVTRHNRSLPTSRKRRDRVKVQYSRPGVGIKYTPSMIKKRTSEELKKMSEEIQQQYKEGKIELTESEIKQANRALLAAEQRKNEIAVLRENRKLMEEAKVQKTSPRQPKSTVMSTEQAQAEKEAVNRTYAKEGKNQAETAKRAIAEEKRIQEMHAQTRPQRIAQTIEANEELKRINSAKAFSKNIDGLEDALAKIRKESDPNKRVALAMEYDLAGRITQLGEQRKLAGQNLKLSRANKEAKLIDAFSDFFNKDTREGKELFSRVKEGEKVKGLGRLFEMSEKKKEELKTLASSTEQAFMSGAKGKGAGPDGTEKLIRGGYEAAQRLNTDWALAEIARQKAQGAKESEVRQLREELNFLTQGRPMSELENLRALRNEFDSNKGEAVARGERLEQAAIARRIKNENEGIYRGPREEILYTQADKKKIDELEREAAYKFIDVNAKAQKREQKKHAIKEPKKRPLRQSRIRPIRRVI